MKARAFTAEQGSDEWLVERIPYVTASNVSKVMAKGQGVSRYNYMVIMACEILSGKPTPGFKSKYMQAGNDNEPMVREIYELMTGKQVTEKPFHAIDEEMLGGSIDGDVDADGFIEIKNVIAPEQIRLLTTNKIKSEYIKQIQTNMYVYEKKWCDFVSASLGDENGELPDHHKIKIIRVMRDEDMIMSIRKEVSFFHRDLKEMLNKLGGTK